uniref:Uncharacterized protein n=1 Tax=Anguilla anguilla TaxID=7936 RepID=A0A0E9WGD4_ANGAN
MDCFSHISLPFTQLTVSTAFIVPLVKVLLSSNADLQ